MPGRFGPKPGAAILVHEYGTDRPIPINSCQIVQVQGNKGVWTKENAASQGKPNYVPLKAGVRYHITITAPGYNDYNKTFSLSKGAISYFAPLFPKKHK